MQAREGLGGKIRRVLLAWECGHHLGNITRLSTLAKRRSGMPTLLEAATAFLASGGRHIADFERDRAQRQG